MGRKSYYMVLGVSRTESPSGIRQAFRELVKRYHPDRVGPQGLRFFQEIVEAHRVLLRGRRFVVENEEPELPIGLIQLAAENGLWVGEKR